jgi:hypothetical protein
MEKSGKGIKKRTGSLASLVVGIDPGKGGGMAVIKSNVYDFGAKIFTAHNCPKTIEGMVGFISMLKSESPYITCFLEKVHAFPTDGRSSAFKFGMNYGIWRGILCAFGIKTELVTPQAWQKTFGELPKNKQERKRKLRDIATEKSTIKATLKTADAICIALYGYEIMKTGRQWKV